MHLKLVRKHSGPTEAFYSTSKQVVRYFAIRYKNQALVIDTNLAYHNIWRLFISTLYFIPNPMLAENKDAKLELEI